MKRRGRHQSTDKNGRVTIAKLQRIMGVTAVIIGRSIGGKSIGRGRAAGDFKLQGRVPGGMKGVMQTSRGVQELFVRIDGSVDEAEIAIRQLFPDA